MDTLENVLCLQGQQKNYLVKLSDMVEICTHVSISKIPCLPLYYLGIFHYKGNILPVLQLDENVFSLTDTTILVVKHDKEIVQKYKKRTILIEDGCIKTDTSVGGYVDGVH